MSSTYVLCTANNNKVIRTFETRLNCCNDNNNLQVRGWTTQQLCRGCHRDAVTVDLSSVQRRHRLAVSAVDVFGTNRAVVESVVNSFGWHSPPPPPPATDRCRCAAEPRGSWCAITWLSCRRRPMLSATATGRRYNSGKNAWRAAAERDGKMRADVRRHSLLGCAVRLERLVGDLVGARINKDSCKQELTAGLSCTVILDLVV